MLISPESELNAHVIDTIFKFRNDPNNSPGT